MTMVGKGDRLVESCQLYLHQCFAFLLQSLADILEAPRSYGAVSLKRLS